MHHGDIQGHVARAPPFPGLPASETLLHPLLPAHPSTSRRGQRCPRRLLCSRSCLCPRRSRLLSQGDSRHCRRLPPSHPVSQQPLSCSARAQSSLLSSLTPSHAGVPSHLLTAVFTGVSTLPGAPSPSPLLVRLQQGVPSARTCPPPALPGTPKYGSGCSPPNPPQTRH